MIKQATTVLQARLRSIQTPEGNDLSTVQVEGPFHVALYLEVGVNDHPGTDTFEVWVCNVAWLEQEALPLSGQFLIVVKSFEPDSIRQFLERKINQVSADTSEQLLEKLSRIAYWEFADVPRRPRRLDDTSSF